MKSACLQSTASISASIFYSEIASLVMIRPKPFNRLPSSYKFSF